MSTRELIALGTSSQIPTRERNHNAYFLRWDDEGILFDPGEGTQRQLMFANVSATDIHHICVTHFHGDHCLGLPGVLQRLALDACNHPVYVHFPESGGEFFERLRSASIYRSSFEASPRPIPDQIDGLRAVFQTAKYTLFAHSLEHTVPCLGFRVEERPGRRFLPERLAALGISGPAVGQLAHSGELHIDGRIVTLEEVSVQRPGSAFALAMDTRPCKGAKALGANADLFVMEATYVQEHRELAGAYGHSTAAGAAATAQQAGARLLALTHFSQRYRDTEIHLSEAKAIFPSTVVLNDLDRITIPRPTQPR